ncbi:uncharacterized protein [Heptranchias perlo]|uniref:uncharacterized protein n=1 Tax=Heptranchias perlo TaxID=212740 RepID=UPI00355A9545
MEAIVGSIGRDWRCEIDAIEAWIGRTGGAGSMRSGGSIGRTGGAGSIARQIDRLEEAGAAEPEARGPMGIQGLDKLIGDVAPGAVREKQIKSDFATRSLWEVPLLRISLAVKSERKWKEKQPDLMLSLSFEHLSTATRSLWEVPLLRISLAVKSERKWKEKQPDLMLSLSFEHLSTDAIIGTCRPANGNSLLTVTLPVHLIILNTSITYPGFQFESDIDPISDLFRVLPSGSSPPVPRPSRPGNRTHGMT